VNKTNGEQAREQKSRGGISQGVNKPGDEQAMGRTSQGANWQRSEKARHPTDHE